MKPYTMSIWQPSLIDAHQFLNQYALGDNLVQLLPDAQMKYGFWIVLRVTGDQMAALQNMDLKPKLSTMP